MFCRQAEALRGLARRIELNEHRGLPSDDPSVVTRLDHDDGRRREVERAAVTVLTLDSIHDWWSVANNPSGCRDSGVCRPVGEWADGHHDEGKSGRHVIEKGTTLRAARPTDHLEHVLRFYTDGLGLSRLGSFEDH